MMELFLQKDLLAKSRLLFSQKSSILDVRLCSTYTSTCFIQHLSVKLHILQDYENEQNSEKLC